MPTPRLVQPQQTDVILGSMLREVLPEDLARLDGQREHVVGARDDVDDAVVDDRLRFARILRRDAGAVQMRAPNALELRHVAAVDARRAASSAGCRGCRRSSRQPSRGGAVSAFGAESAVALRERRRPPCSARSASAPTRAADSPPHASCASHRLHRHSADSVRNAGRRSIPSGGLTLAVAVTTRKRRTIKNNNRRSISGGNR